MVLHLQVFFSQKPTLAPIGRFGYRRINLSCLACPGDYFFSNVCFHCFGNIDIHHILLGVHLCGLVIFFLSKLVLSYVCFNCFGDIDIHHVFLCIDLGSLIILFLAKLIPAKPPPMMTMRSLVVWGRFSVASSCRPISKEQNGMGFVPL